MSDESNEHPSQRSLPVLPNSGKVDQLRDEAKAAPAPTPAAAPAPKHVDSTLVSRFVDANKTPKQKAIEEKVIAAIQTVYDPEIPLNIYDLGLIYDVDIDTDRIAVTMTLTSEACPSARAIPEDVKTKLSALGASDVTVDVTFDPPWHPARISPDGKQKLGLA
jgi:metal-sulfur cluster biosynthetic enzyme